MGEVSMRIFFNITMERLPCQFAVVDVEDIMGTSVTNVSKEILKFKIAPDSGHRQEFYIDEQPSIVHEELDPQEQEMHMARPTELPRLKDDDFERIGKAADSQALCQKHHIHAFPTIRIYRHRQLHSHENYLGDRDSAAFVSFIEEALPKGVVAGGDQQRALPAIATKTEGHDMQGEGCQLTGSLQISRVPGNFRISAKSDSHSFNTRVMNVSHHVDKLVFGAINEAGRLKQVMPMEERSSLFSTSFMMHQELATLKHYLKVVPYQYNFLDGERHHTYLYKANYNEYRPRKLEWFEGKADAHIDTALVPNAVFHYDISPVMVVVREETQAFATFVTKICAVIGGIYTVIGLIDNVIYHGGQSIKKAF